MTDEYRVEWDYRTTPAIFLGDHEVSLGEAVKGLNRLASAEANLTTAREALAALRGVHAGSSAYKPEVALRMADAVLAQLHQGERE